MDSSASTYHRKCGHMFFGTQCICVIKYGNCEFLAYLGVFMIRAVKFKCSIDQVKRSFCRAANGIFAKIGRLASEEVMVQLLKQKCLPILPYALDVS